MTVWTLYLYPSSTWIRLLTFPHSTVRLCSARRNCKQYGKDTFGPECVANSSFKTSNVIQKPSFASFSPSYTAKFPTFAADPEV